VSVKRLRLPARVVLFDWDGTLLDSFAADTRAYLAMFSGLGIAWTAEDLYRNYSPNWHRVYRAAKIKQARWDEANRLWREAYGRENPKLLPGVRGLLRSLAKRFGLGIVTSGDRDRVRLQLKNLDLAKYFAAVVCSEDTVRKKPHPAPLRRALALLGAAPNECVYVGDSRQDMEMAQRAGVRAVGVFGPFPTADGLRATKPVWLLKSVRELPRYLESTKDSVASAEKTTRAKRAAAHSKKRAKKQAKKRRAPNRSAS
jgi:HAD superfamily hydrolase (TIGR01549 family)